MINIFTFTDNVLELKVNLESFCIILSILNCWQHEYLQICGNISLACSINRKQTNSDSNISADKNSKILKKIQKTLKSDDDVSKFIQRHFQVKMNEKKVIWI